jgi:hypothetical protein
MAFSRDHLRFSRFAALGLVLSVLALPSRLMSSQPPTVGELKARVANARISDRPALCIHISELQLDAADRLYVAGDSQKAKAALVDVVAFSELARDYAIQTRKHEKQSEIAIRKMVHKLGDMKHTVFSHDDQAQVQTTIDRLQRIRDDLLAAMFPKGIKK